MYSPRVQLASKGFTRHYDNILNKLEKPQDEQQRTDSSARTGRCAIDFQIFSFVKVLNQNKLINAILSLKNNNMAVRKNPSKPWKILSPVPKTACASSCSPHAHCMLFSTAVFIWLRKQSDSLGERPKGKKCGDYNSSV